MTDDYLTVSAREIGDYARGQRRRVQQPQVDSAPPSNSASIKLALVSLMFFASLSWVGATIGVLILAVSLFLWMNHYHAQSSLPMPTGNGERIHQVGVLRTKYLTGRPLYLIELDDMLTPVVQAESIDKGTILEVIAHCWLVDEIYGVRPDHGIAILDSGEQYDIPFNQQGEERLQSALQAMSLKHIPRQ